MNENKRIIEINGVKIEVDMQTAKRIDEFRIGDNVKVLTKDYSGYKVLPGVIIDFVNFKDLPTIQIAVFEESYASQNINFINFNARTKDVEIALVSEHELVLEKNKVMDRLNAEIEKKRNEMESIIAKKEYLEKHFGKYFEYKEKE